ncbi:MAG: prepilin-type N-terminal cleavage/methylation domain-containing protein, partial [Bacilli bacterium]|nr:prepilin-type N-terminal cleavage/methylation domain-containing protein [Bacilli bacterium]
MIKNLRKKGFTIVELVIVIAVIAILAAILIPTFSGIIKKANIASDTAMAKNMNTALVMADSEGNVPEDMGDVLFI